MIDFRREKLISLIEATNLVPPRNGRKIHVSTLYRWTSRGLHGVYLEYAQVGSTRMVSAESLARFFSRLAGVGNQQPAADAAAEAELDQEGI